MVHFLGLPAIHVDLPRLSRARRYWIDLCSGFSESLKELSYAGFLAAVTAGRKNNTMPSFRQNKNVMCYLDNIYIYLRAVPGTPLNAAGPRSINRNRPPQRKPKTNASAHCGTGRMSRKTDANRQSIWLISCTGTFPSLGVMMRVYSR